MKNISLLVITLIMFAFCANAPAQKKIEQASETIGKIIAKTGSSTISGTVDVIKEGNPETEVTGIITCMFATMEVLKEAVETKCNLIIVHEPLYYNHMDETKQFQNDPVYLEKHKYITDNKLVIWRFHDYIHRMNPDGIETGMVEKLGWVKYAADGQTDKFLLPETTLGELLKYLKTIFPENGFNVIGNSDMKIKGVRLAAGAPGSIKHIKLLEESFTDLVIAGESPQWETYEYMRDAVSQGRQKAIIFLGHIASEEAGMEYCAKWMKGFISGVPVNFVKSGASYRTF
jgi:putative NIF3 family GTP cyclohydrolase 1 type 2